MGNYIYSKWTKDRESNLLRTRAPSRSSPCTTAVDEATTGALPRPSNLSKPSSVKSSTSRESTILESPEDWRYTCSKTLSRLRATTTPSSTPRTPLDNLLPPTRMRTTRPTALPKCTPSLSSSALSWLTPTLSASEWHLPQVTNLTTARRLFSL